LSIFDFKFIFPNSFDFPEACSENSG